MKKRLCALFLAVVMLAGLLPMYAFAAETAVMPGDVDGNGKLNSDDAIHLLRHYMKPEEYAINQSGDMDGNGKVNSDDAIYLLRHYMKPEEFPLPEVIPPDESDPVITKQPENQVLEEGGVATLSVAVDYGVAPYSYQWKRDGKNIAGANAAEYEASEPGSYVCVIKDANGKEVTSIVVVVQAAEPEKKEYTVVFKGMNGDVLSTDTVEEGSAAVAPTAPQINGYRFLGWDISFDKVYSDLTVNAQYEKIELEANEYNIEYYLSGNSVYLQQLEAQGKIDNSNNPVTYKEGEKVALLNPQVPGYNFKGWYDSAGSNANRVYQIVDRIGTVQLYAQWEVVEYKVQFKSDLIPTDPVTYNIEEGKVLPVPYLDGYIFVGWSDDDGNILKEIPAGTVGHKTYSANWLSERNQAWAKNDIGDPIIVEEDNKILFIYEIGEIRNVPLTLIHDFGKINDNGVSKEVTKTYSTTISKEYMVNYTNAVSKATTESYGWALDKGWSEGITVNEEWAKENNMTVEEAKEVCTNDEENWYVSSGQSGSNTTTTVDTTDTYNLKTSTENRKNSMGNETEDREDFSAEFHVDLKYGMEAGAGIDGVASAKSSVEAGFGGSLERKQGTTNKTNNSFESNVGDSDETGTVTHRSDTMEHTSSWNSEAGTGGSHSVSNTDSVSKAISEAISNKTGYGEEYVQSGNENVTQQTASSNSSSDEYSAGVTWGEVITEQVTEKYETSNTMSGYHRWVIAGTAHVFGVVGYDIETASYFVSTYSVMDSKTHEFEDYSYSYASYDDNQSGQIPFNVPMDIISYVGDRIMSSNGLEVSKDGVITDYTGTEEFVVIPEYVTVRNIDGTNSAIKITGLDANAFAGKDFIKVIELSDYIEAIPENAFRNCTALEFIEGEGVTAIGARAFAGCTNLKYCTVGENVVDLGVGIFEGMEEAIVDASNAAVVQAGVQSGAKNICLFINESCTNLNDVTLTIPAGVETFAFHGGNKIFNNLVIDSAADCTVISGATINSTSKTPLRLASEKIILQEVNVTAPGLSMISSAQNAVISLYGKSSLKSDNENTFLCRKVSFEKYNMEGQSVYSHLSIDGNMLICGEKVSNSLMSLSSGNQILIDEAAFEKYQKGSFRLTFNPNGGTVALEEKTVYYGQTLGELPTPERGEAYIFEGWYTAQDGGTMVTSETDANMDGDATLYAHWKLNQFTAAFDANGGTVEETSRKVTCSQAIGELPVPTKDYHKFDGWYTAQDGGERITDATVWNTAEDVTLYAHWTENGVSDWVLESALPAGAEVVGEKWSYTKTTFTESMDTALEGYTATGNSHWQEVGSGSQDYASFPKGFDKGHAIYKDTAKSEPYQAAETETTKREVSSKKAGYIYWHWMWSTEYNSTTKWAISPYSGKWDTYGNKGKGANYTMFYAMKSDKDCSYLGTGYCCSNNMKSYDCTSILPSNKSGVGTPRFFRFDYYTCSYVDYAKVFEYMKEETLESKTEITASDNISNVQKWVQYREK